LKIKGARKNQERKNIMPWITMNGTHVFVNDKGEVQKGPSALLEEKKQTLLKQVSSLVAEKKRLYSNMDITKPMSTKEKELNKKIASIYSNINKVVSEKRRIAR
jgi:hypothetical protein